MYQYFIQLDLIEKAFENATKRNKPNVDIGDLLYCRILTGNKDMEPELVCIDGSGKANGLGVLKEGFMFKINLELGRRQVLIKSKGQLFFIVNLDCILLLKDCLQVQINYL